MLFDFPHQIYCAKCAIECVRPVQWDCFKWFSFFILRRAKFYSVLEQEIGSDFKVKGLPQLLELLKQNFKGKLQLMQLIDLFLVDLLAWKIHI